MSKVKVTGGLTFGSVLFVVFLVLKLTHAIDWPWVWVTAPLWISLGLSLIVLAVIGLFLVTVAILATKEDKYK